MPAIYYIIIKLYYFSIHIASPFNKKAQLWIRGREGIFEDLQKSLNRKDRIAWFHCASLGEFEQGRPVIEKFREQYPDIRILLTFFSPSGYEIRKNYSGVDHIFYLPPDSPRNSKRFIDIVDPEVVYFIKYEYWYYYLKRLKMLNVPVFLISAIFRKDQIFFRWYGSWYCKLLKYFSHLFVQNESSKELLDTIRIKNVTVSGDTRFDRVASSAAEPVRVPVAESFIKDKMTLIAGSTWNKDEEIITEYINKTDNDIRFIIAPHEISKDNINRLHKSIKRPCLLFSEAEKDNVREAQVIIIDNIGMLSSLYQYGSIAYIGGGFGKGIHNILEAACFGIPVFFGPIHDKFNEACELISKKGAFCIRNYNEFKDLLDRLLKDDLLLKESGKTAGEYVQKNVGATDIILKKTIKYLNHPASGT